MISATTDLQKERSIISRKLPKCKESEIASILRAEIICILHKKSFTFIYVEDTVFSYKVLKLLGIAIILTTKALY